MSPFPCQLIRSEFFRGLLSSGLSEDGISEFTVTDTDRDTLALLLEFLYTGRVQETPEHLGDHQVFLISIPPFATGTRLLSSADHHGGASHCDGQAALSKMPE